MASAATYPQNVSLKLSFVYTFDLNPSNLIDSNLSNLFVILKSSM